MWAAKQEHENYKAMVRRSGKFAGDSLDMLMRAVFEFGWLSIASVMVDCCRNRAATAILDGNIAEAELWIARAKAIKEIK